MADHSFITLYAHIGRRILRSLTHSVCWVQHQPLLLLVLAVCIGITLAYIFPYDRVTFICGVDMGKTPGVNI